MSTLDLAARLVFHRVVQSRADGWTEVFATGDDDVLVASSGSRATAVREAPVTGDITLTLADSFELSGVIELPMGTALVDGAEIWVGPADVNARSCVAKLPVRSDGSFGPARCPLLPAQQYGFNLLSTRVLSEYVLRSTPSIDEQVFVRFEGRVPSPVEVRVTDDKGGPIAGAAVGVFWAGPLSANDVFAQPMLTNADGRATLAAPAEGALNFRVRRTGFVPLLSGPVLLDAREARHVDLELKRGGRIEGRVVSGAEPVKAFQLVFWPPANADETRYEFFEGRDDGRFAVEAVEVRSLLAYAASKTHPRSEIVAIAFQDGVADLGTLELAPSLRGRGRVIDAETRAPLVGASAQTWNCWGYRILSAQSAPVLVDADGAFELDGLRPGQNTIWVQAPGYHWAQPNVSAEVGDEADIGLVPLERTVPLSFQLVSEEPRDFTAFALSASRTVDFPLTSFPADGRLEVPGCARGDIEFGVDYPDGSTAYFVHQVERAVPADVAHTVANELDVDVRARIGAACDGATDLQVGLCCDDHGVFVARWMYLDEAGRAHFVGLPRGPFSVVVQAGDRELHRSRFEPKGKREQTLELDVACRSKTLRVLASDGSPRARGSVLCACVAEGPPAFMHHATDDEGRLSIAWPDCGELLVCAVGPSPRFGLRVAVDDSIEQEIVLPAASRLELRVHDRGEALAGVLVSARESSSDLWLDPAVSNASGIGVWDDIGPGAYDVVVDGQGFWRVARQYTVSDGARLAADLDVRRLGGVDFEIRGALGEAVAGARVTLASTEFGETSDQWIAEHRVPSTNPSSETSGLVTLDGLPNGDYTWTVACDDGRSATGTLVVPPGTRTKFVATVTN
ncbi:MAG: carboxypeptidase-like regulatory domain-containing protein [Planctomycetes bacterium]|nr:carboxypeptidase-like regulatory domain-containing protein [Planctomycetota bacterium]